TQRRNSNHLLQQHLSPSCYVSTKGTKRIKIAENGANESYLRGHAETEASQTLDQKRSLLPLLLKLAQQLLIRLTTKIQASKQIRSALAGAAQGLFAPPAGDVGVVPGEEDVGDAPAAKFGGACVLWVF